MTSSRHGALRRALLVVATTALLGGLSLAGVVWLRVPVAVAWLLLVPGWPWALRLRLADRGDTTIAAVAISMALAAAIGGAMAVLHVWSPVAAVLVLAALATTGAVLPARRRAGSTARPPASSEPS